MRIYPLSLYRRRERGPGELTRPTDTAQADYDPSAANTEGRNSRVSPEITPGRLFRRALAISLAVLVGGAMFGIPWALAAPAATPASEDPNDYDYRFEVDLVNNNTTTDWAGPMPVEVNTQNLVDGGYIDAAGLETLFTDSHHVSRGGFLEDVTAEPSTWWWYAEVAQDGGGATVVAHIGAATSSHRFPLGGGTDRIEVTDDASLDISNDLTLEASVNLDAIPMISTRVVYKGVDWGFGVQNGNEIYVIRWLPTTATTTRPISNGTTIELTRDGCAQNFECVDEVRADDAATRNLTTSATPEIDTYGMTTTTIPVTSTITSVVVTGRAGEGATISSTIRLLVSLSGTSTYGTPFDSTSSFANFSSTLARPGGGNWAVADINAMEVGAELTSNGTHNLYLTQLFAEINYATGTASETDPPTYSPITAGNTYNVEVNFDNPVLSLYVDDVLRATSSAPLGFDVNADPLIIGNGVTGWVDDVRIGHTSVTSPTIVLDLEFEPAHITSIQQGNSGNGWLWRGNVSNQCCSGNNGDYYLTADTSQISTTINGLTVVGVVAPVGLPNQGTSSRGELPLDILSQEQTQHRLEGLVVGPYRDILTGTNIPARAMVLILASIIGAVLAGKLAKATPTWRMVAAALIFGFVYFAATIMIAGELVLVATVSVGMFGVVNLMAFVRGR